MDSEFARLIDDAADIAASGRWDAANERIKYLTAHPGEGNEWWVQLFGCLCYQVFSEYLALKRAYQEQQKEAEPLIAWRARNLLELVVWSLYCSKSRENARRLYEDAGRDVLGILSAFAEYGLATAKDTGWFNMFTGAKQDLTNRAAADGTESLDGPYKRVSEAATECGIGDHFRLSYRMLSKFAHPTAMQILAPPDEARTALQRDCFFSQGCLFFTGAFVALESRLISTGGIAPGDAESK